MKKFERITEFSPAFDRRHTDPAKNYGIHAVQCRMVLIGANGAIHFVFSTGIFLPETMQEYAKDGKLNPSRMEGSGEYFMLNKPMGYDIGYHSFSPKYPEQTISKEDCPYIKAPCYSDGSSTRADEIMDVLIRKGSEAVWKIMEKDYKEILAK